MNYAAMSGRQATQQPNPANPANAANPATSSNPSYNFMPTQGVGSNQYQSLPSWLNTGSFGNWTAGGGSGGPIMNYMPAVGGGVSSTGMQTGGYAYGSPGYGLGVPQQGQGYGAPASSWTGAGGGPILGGGLFSVEQPVDPALQGSMAGYLTSQVGHGVSPFNLPTQLPFGGTTQPGQLTAMANPLLQNLMSYYQGGQSSTPGANTLSTIANQGISALPEWQAMVQAMGQNNAQNLQQLKEQSAGMGGMAGSPFGNAASNYLQGVTSQQNALLGQLQQQNILQGQIPVAEGLLSGGQQFGQYAQGLNQQAITNMLTEMIRTSPQYNPTLGYQFGMATSYDPVLSRAGQTQGGALDAILGNLGNILTGAGNLYGKVNG